MEAGLILIAALVVGIVVWRSVRTVHNAGWFVAKASGALFDLGLDVKRLPPSANEKFFREGRAAFEATKNRPTTNRYNPKLFAMAFFVWYGVEYKLVDQKAFLRKGVLADSIRIMRKWAKSEPELHGPVELHVKTVFQYLYDSFEAMSAPKNTILTAQLRLLEIMKDSEPAT